ncbi:MAG: prepilin-type N-terminal cleavage/methylation domain-containing protein [Gammaproteobacteria bacterium]
MKRVSGFGMVELMVVIAIISILAILVVPEYKRYRDRVTMQTAVLNIQNIVKVTVSDLITQKPHVTVADGTTVLNALSANREALNTAMGPGVVGGARTPSNRYAWIFNLVGRTFVVLGFPCSEMACSPNAPSWVEATGIAQEVWIILNSPSPGKITMGCVGAFGSPLGARILPAQCKSTVVPNWGQVLIDADSVSTPIS